MCFISAKKNFFYFLLPLASSVGANQQDSDVSLMETDTSDVAAGQHTLESSEYKGRHWSIFLLISQEPGSYYKLSD